MTDKKQTLGKGFGTAADGQIPSAGNVSALIVTGKELPPEVAMAVAPHLENNPLQGYIDATQAVKRVAPGGKEKSEIPQELRENVDIDYDENVARENAERSGTHFSIS